ncbi:hypothetical protein D3C76_1712900 [compost metagenome]
MAQASELDATDVIERQVGDIHVQYRAWRQVQLAMGFDQFSGEVGGGRQVIDLP